MTVKRSIHNNGDIISSPFYAKYDIFEMTLLTSSTHFTTEAK